VTSRQGYSLAVTAIVGHRGREPRAGSRRLVFRRGHSPNDNTAIAGPCFSDNFVKSKPQIEGRIISDAAA
jgi:hypothetical protein